MGALLQEHFAAEVEYIGGAGGVFEVTVEGREVFSKAKDKTFPDPAALIATIKKVTT